MTESRSRWILPTAAIGAVLATALFYVAVLKIPAASRDLMQQGFAERITVGAIPSLIERRQRMDEVREFLDKRINEGTIHDVIYAYRGRLVAAEQGPEEAFSYLANLLAGRNLNEMTAGWLEMARFAGLAERWDNFFSLCMLLADYGETEAIQGLFEELRQAGTGVAKALNTFPGVAFLAYANWEKRPIEELQTLPEDARGGLILMRAAEEIRWDNKLSDPGKTVPLLKELMPQDPRALYLIDYQLNAGKARYTPNVFRSEPVLRPGEFIHHGKPLPGNAILFNGSYEAKLNSPHHGPLWMVCSATAVLQIFPLVYVHLDDEMSVRYLPLTRMFPVELQRRDGKPFSKIRIELVNDLTSQRLKQDRNILIQGFYASEDFPLPATAPASAPITPAQTSAR